MEDTKVCKTCTIEKPWVNFPPRSKVCRVCQTTYHKEWYEKNKEKHKAQMLAWRTKNAESEKARRKRWKTENYEHVSASNKAYREANSEKVKSGVKAANEKNWLRAVARSRLQAARDNEIPVLLSIDDILDIYKQQNGICAVTKMPMIDKGDSGVIRNWCAPSIDRIEPSLGYVAGNVRWVCLAVNLGKSKFPDDIYYAVCAAVVENYRPLAVRMDKGL